MSEVKNIEIKQGTQSTILRVLANVISVVFHPVFMPTAVTLILHSLSPTSFLGVPDSLFNKWLGIVAFLTIFFPLFSTFLMVKLGFVTGFKMEDPKDRIIPLIATMIYYFWVNHVFYNIGVPLILHVLTLGIFWGVIVQFMVNIFFKLSMHTMAAGGVLGIMIILLFTNPVSMAIPFFAAVIAAGLIGTARLLLGAHSPVEVWAGYLLGLIVQLGAYWYLG